MNSVKILLIDNWLILANKFFKVVDQTEVALIVHNQCNSDVPNHTHTRPSDQHFEAFNLMKQNELFLRQTYQQYF